EIHNIYEARKNTPLVKKLKADMGKLIAKYKQTDAAEILEGKAQ
ncbi:hypothetical protein SAMN05192529_12841, partial [Arachidicoccus rhizosphaerae]